MSRRSFVSDCAQISLRSYVDCCNGPTGAGCQLAIRVDVFFLQHRARYARTECRPLSRIIASRDDLVLLFIAKFTGRLSRSTATRFHHVQSEGAMMANECYILMTCVGILLQVMGKQPRRGVAREISGRDYVISRPGG